MADTIIRNGKIVDGTGKKSYKADIAITGDKITQIGNIDTDIAGRIIDAKDKTITPGFIDPHTHVDLTILFAPEMEPYIRQGVTTVVSGNCGYGLAPMNDSVFYGSFMNLDFLEQLGDDGTDILPLFFDRKRAEVVLKDLYSIDLDWNSFASFNEKCNQLPLGCNVAPLAGYNAIRTAVMGKDCLREATEEELKEIEKLTEECMKSGAFGLSTGRDHIYLPGPYATDEETHRMLSIVASHGGIFTSHTYNFNKEEKPDRLGGYEEMVRQAGNLNLKMNVSHVHVSGMADTPQGALKAAEKTLDYFHKLNESGIDITYDVIPSPTCADYTHKSFGFFIQPLILSSGSRAKLAEDFRSSEFRDMVKEKVKRDEIMSHFNTDHESHWFGDLCVMSHRDESLVGKYMTTCADELNMEPLDAMMYMFSEDPDMIADFAEPSFGEAVELLCNDNFAMPCSDGGCHPKDYNLTGNDEIPILPNSMNSSYIPRFLTRYRKGNFEQAVHQASGFVAKRFGIKNRGEILEGNYADIVIMDESKLKSFDENADFLRDPEGIEQVLVNGQLALDNSKLTESGTGKMLRFSE